MKLREISACSGRPLGLIADGVFFVQVNFFFPFHRGRACQHAWHPPVHSILERGWGENGVEKKEAAGALDMSTTAPCFFFFGVEKHQFRTTTGKRESERVGFWIGLTAGIRAPSSFIAQSQSQSQITIVTNLRIYVGTQVFFFFFWILSVCPRGSLGIIVLPLLLGNQRLTTEGSPCGVGSKKSQYVGFFFFFTFFPFFVDSLETKTVFILAILF